MLPVITRKKRSHFYLWQERTNEMQVGEVGYRLKTGDSLYFNSVQKHGLLPVSDEAIYVDIFV